MKIIKMHLWEETNDVISIAIMTDTDNTDAMAETYFSDIVVSKIPRLKTQVARSTSKNK